MTDEVRGKLGAVPGVQVIARGSSIEYRKTDQAPQQIARELGARLPADRHGAVGEGRGGASRVRVSPELVDARPGHAPRTRCGSSRSTPR